METAGNAASAAAGPTGAATAAAAAANTTTTTTTQTAEAGYDEIYVNPVCYVQTGKERFGPAIAEEIRNYVAEPTHQTNNGWGEPGWEEMDDDSSDDDSDDDDNTDAFESGPTDWDGYETSDLIYSDGSVHDSNHHSPHHPGAGAAGGGFPKAARHRCNLTALSQKYNLYFVAYQDKIHVFQPRKGPRILPPPVLVLSPVRTKLAKLYPGELDRKFPHQINHLIVGNLGSLEIVLFAFDDGDVGAYYTHAIAGYIKAAAEAEGKPRTQHPHVPRQFFAENVGLSAWGLAAHQQSRLIAVGSNRREVTVFAFALRRDRHRPPAQAPPTMPDDSAALDESPKVWSGQTALELQKHFRSRTRTWKMIFPLGIVAHNIPSVSFMDDSQGSAEKVVAMDITSHTWIVDLWSIGVSPIIYTSSLDRCARTFKGWTILALPDSAFKRTKDVRETLGLPENEVIKAHMGARTRLDTTCSLYHIKELALDPTQLLISRSAANYKKVHEDGPIDTSTWDNVSGGPSEESPPSSDWESATDLETEPVPETFLNSLAGTVFGVELNPDGPGVVWNAMGIIGNPVTGSTSTTQPPPADERWATITTDPAPSGSALDDASSDVQMRRDIIPVFGETLPTKQPPPNTFEYMRRCKEREKRTRPIAFEKAALPNYLSKDYSLLRATLTDVELLSLDPACATVWHRWVLTYHNYHKISPNPHQFSQAYAERINMVLHVPELYLVIAGSPTGRVALITLTKTPRQRVYGVQLKRGFRVDRVLPRKADEENRLRPWCALIGIAVSPVPSPRARGLELRSPSAKKQGLLPTTWRLILHYLDHTILMYDIARRDDDELLVF